MLISYSIKKNQNKRESAKRVVVEGSISYERRHWNICISFSCQLFKGKIQKGIFVYDDVVWL